MTLRWRIALVLAAVAIAVGGTAALAAYASTASQLRSSIDDTLRSRAVAVNTITPPGRDGHGGPDGDAADGTDACPTAGSFQPASGAQLVDDHGTITNCIAGGPTLPLVDTDTGLRQGQVDLRTVSIDGEQYRLLTTPWHAGGRLQIARSLAETNSLLSRLRLQLGLLVAVAALFAAGIGWLIATRLVRPIERLRDATHRIATTLDLSTPIDVRASGEVGDLAASFSAMVAEVDRSQQQQRRLVSDASHEMRTPLTSLRSNLELIDRIERLPVDERHEVVGDVLEDIDELSTLLAELVDLASDLANAEDAEPVQLDDLARTVAARTERRTGRHVTVSDTGSTPVVGRPRQLERAINHLVDNAAKYSDPSAPIDVVIVDQTVAVRDRGPGIDPADLDHIFDRFYRAVSVRTQPGSGLGLSIVDEIVRSHGGTTFARNRDDGGAEIGFTLLPSPAQP